MRKSYHFSLPFVLFPLAVIAVGRGGYSLFLIPLFLAILVWIDFRVGPDHRNPDTAASRRSLRSYNFLLITWLPLQVVTLLYFLHAATHTGSLGTHELILLAVLTGFTLSSRGGAVGHELSHRHSKAERFAGEILLSSICFVHYITEHVYIHHSKVATTQDPVTARKGQGFYRYFLASMTRGLLLSWTYERSRLLRQGLPMLHVKNPFWRRTLMLAAWIAVCGLIGGAWAIVLFLTQSLAAILALRAMDYIQHYGLQRQYDAKTNLWEPVALHHSWNCNLPLNNLMLFNLMRHADHHHKASRQYPLIQGYPESTAPHLPFSSSIMVLIALIPPIWFYIMDPLIERWRAAFYPQIRDWSPFENPLYEKRPGSARLIGEISSTVPELAKWMNRQPALLDKTLSTRFANLDFPDSLEIDAEELKIARRGVLLVYYLQELDLQELGKQLQMSGLHNAEDITDGMVDWSNQVIFQACVRVLQGHMFASDITLIYENIFRTYVNALTDALMHEMDINPKTDNDYSFAVILLDRLDSSWTLLDWKFDLVVVYDASEKSIHSVHQSFSALTKRLQTSIQSLARNSMMIHTTHSAVGVFSIQELSRKTWEISEECVLTDARVVYARGGMEERFQTMQRNILTRESDPEDIAIDLTFAQERRIPQQVAFGQSAILMEIQRIKLLIYYLLRIHLKDYPDILSRDIQSVFQKLRTHALIEKESVDRLSTGIVFLNNAYGALSLITHEEFDADTATAESKAFLAHACDAEDFPALLELARKTSEQIGRISAKQLS